MPDHIDTLTGDIIDSEDVIRVARLRLSTDNWFLGEYGERFESRSGDLFVLVDDGRPEGACWFPAVTYPEDSQVRRLRAEALAAGDSEMADACDRALSGYSDARQICGEAIDEAAAMAGA